MTKELIELWQLLGGSVSKNQFGPFLSGKLTPTAALIFTQAKNRKQPGQATPDVEPDIIDRLPTIDLED